MYELSMYVWMYAYLKININVWLFVLGMYESSYMKVCIVSMHVYVHAHTSMNFYMHVPMYA